MWSPTSRDSSSRSLSGRLDLRLVVLEPDEYDKVVLIGGNGAASMATMNVVSSARQIMANRDGIVADSAMVVQDLA